MQYHSAVFLALFLSTMRSYCIPYAKISQVKTSNYSNCRSFSVPEAVKFVYLDNKSPSAIAHYENHMYRVRLFFLKHNTIYKSFFKLYLYGYPVSVYFPVISSKKIPLFHENILSRTSENDFELQQIPGIKSGTKPN